MTKQIQSTEPGLSELDIQMLEVHSLNMKVSSMGRVPLVVLCHVFP